jgi:hypothetical protein
MKINIPSANFRISLPYLNPVNYFLVNYSGIINWGDGVEVVNSYGTREHAYVLAGDYIVTIKNNGTTPWQISGWNGGVATFRVLQG